jgi:radial spoke head protein 9
MEIGELSSLIQAVPDQGLSLSQVEIIKVQCSLRLLQNQMKAATMFFFGKVLGIHNDYYLAFSSDVDKLFPSIFYCSQDAVTWFSLTGIDPEGREEIILLRMPYTGSLISESTLPSGRVINEEQRLAALVADIAEHCLLIPRGYVIKTALSAVLRNPLWSGLPLADYRKLSNIRHWKPREEPLSPLDKTFNNPAVDFIDPLDDLSEWSYDFGGDIEEIKLKSLRWPGFAFYICDTVFANSYFGNGIAEPGVVDLLAEKGDPSKAHRNIH